MVQRNRVDMHGLTAEFGTPVQRLSPPGMVAPPASDRRLHGCSRRRDTRSGSEKFCAQHGTVDAAPLVAGYPFS